LSFSFVVSRSLSLGSIEAEATSKWTIQHGSWFILY
jgi:aromatic ring-opening dioxygenase catalytic subunit (LigB family)